MKNMKMYSKTELMVMQEMAKKPISTIKLAKRLAKEFNRTFGGVYAKLLVMRKHTKVEPVITNTVSTKTVVEGKKHTISSRPTKIEISENGMTFYF